MKKNYKNLIILLLLCIILIIFVTNSNNILLIIINYSKIFLLNVFPSSFIFLLLSILIIDYGIVYTLNNIFNIKSIKLYIYILSIISGFPSGAKYTKIFIEKEYIDHNNANKILMFSHFPNPLFVLGTCRKIINSSTLSLYILISIYISNLIILLCTKKCNINNNITYNYPKSFPNSLNKAINEAFNTIFIIYGTSLFFYLISNYISTYFINNKYLYIIINGIFDLTGGVNSTLFINNKYIKSIIILVLLSFGSISIHIQTKSIISNTDCNYKYYLKGRIISTIISILLFIILNTINFQ